ncbi:hypothetical protein LshimejAT787_0403610 [Lyophyllum shimeji]|uniref:Mtf2-like C-terminal domain-containing protein n=1 Tax=Lyophyllum shimeji TaxID=47721 RepID=A0A9P3PJZ0_LYOSH|nr:hypothetical protein LshimejAT787_0403610 [Lyophyllum shimeji]
MLSRSNLSRCFVGIQKSYEAGVLKSAPSTSSPLLRNPRRHEKSNLAGRRFSTSMLVCSRVSSSPNPVFSNDGSAWNHSFSRDDSNSPHSASFDSSQPLKPAPHSRPRQAMTARESHAFNEMFEMIFDAVAAQEAGSTPPSTSGAAVSVGRGGIDDLIGKLRKYPKRLKLSSELDDTLDRQTEMVNLFTTDQELLEWAIDAVFGESQRYEEAARQAISVAAKSGGQAELPMLQPPTYPHMVALLMRTFREKFDDPHLALSIFEHARRLSIASYVFGCSSQAYHELIETRWKYFRDLKGVHEALEEMKANGVSVDRRTRYLVEKIRREVGERHLWVEESELGSGEIWNILTRIEELVAPVTTRRKPNGSAKPKKWDTWKAERLADEEGDEWGFDQWDKVDAASPARRESVLTHRAKASRME